VKRAAADDVPGAKSVYEALKACSSIRLFVAQISHSVSFLPGLVSKIISAFLSDVPLPRVILGLNMTKKSYQMNLQMGKSVLSGECPDNGKALPLTS
jgi:hypothetical protein